MNVPEKEEGEAAGKAPTPSPSTPAPAAAPSAPAALSTAASTVSTSNGASSKVVINQVYEDLLAHRDAITVPYQRLQLIE